MKEKNIKTEITSAETELIDSIQKSELKITDDDINIIANQKNISYSKIDLVNDIFLILKQYIVINNTNGNNIDCIKNLYENLFTNENNEIKKFVDSENNKIDITTLFKKIKDVLFHTNTKTDNNRYNKSGYTRNVLLDFLKYRNIDEKNSYIDLKYKNNGILKNIDVTDITVNYTTKTNNQINCNYILNTKEVYDKLSNNLITVFETIVPSVSTHFNQMLTSMKTEIDEKVKIYNKNYSNMANISKFSSSQLIAIDINIEKAVKSMEILKNIRETNNNDDTFKIIMNAVDSLKVFFSQDSIRDNRLTGISSIQIKIDKILKKSNEIKGLQLVNQYLFSDTAKGIFLYYEKKKNHHRMMN